MTIGLAERKVKIIDRVAERVRERIEPERARSPERFVRQFYAHVAPSDIVHDTPDNLYGSALGLWQLGERRMPGTPKVRVYTPRVEEHGWHSPHTIVEVVTSDMPFLIESVTSYLNTADAEVHLVIHPIVEVERGEDGRVFHLRRELDGREGAMRESYMHIQVSEQPIERHAEIRAGVERILADVRAAVEDFGPMNARCGEVTAELEARGDAEPESIAFLPWLMDDHFTFLGYRRYAFEGDRAVVEADSGLGVLRDDLADAFQGLLTGGVRPVETQHSYPLRITKANRRSTVHRPVHMDTIGVQRRDEDGQVIGEHLFIGLFTSRAYARSPTEIPILRSKVDFVLQSTEFHPGSYNHKTLVHILDTYPRDELFQIAPEELREIALGVLNLQERQKIALFPRLDPFERFASCLVYVPRDRFDTQLRLRFQHLLEQAFDGTVSSYYTNMSDAAHARLLFIVKTTPGAVPKVEKEALEQQLVEAGRSWGDDLRQALVDARGEHAGLLTYRRFADAFPASYRDHYSPAVAIPDIECIEHALESDEFALNLYRPIEAQAHEVRFKLYACGRAASLSHVLPLLENMGLEVLREVPFRIRPSDEDRPVWLRDFDLVSRDGQAIDLAEVRAGFHEAIALTWRGAMENDGFNQLVLRAGLAAREVTILRAYCKYLRQAGVPFSQEYMEDTLAGSPDVARWLVRLFEVRFDPDHEGERDADAASIVERIQHALAEVTNLDEDRMLRAFLTIIEATLRTNYFQRSADGERKSYVAFKLDSARIPGLPRPRPLYEIFVYSPRVEGVHLRGGRVARGGIRWSDRREDYRTEILGLMKAQMVKNTVIVPVGSKGGFVVKLPPADAKALQGEVVACYRRFVSGLLDLTDNRDGDRVEPPPQVVRRDGDDPYLVVAADKGTATFSDIANSVSGKYRFWLDDAFASGGSAGYDHKKMGITARGAWESVKRHFREIGKNIQESEFTVVGVGDMSGDVFGNGMLLSRHIRLVAAFNHMHVFVDPDPDAARSFDERQRLFDTPGSSWGDYDSSLISAGGGVWSRSAKSIPLSTQIQALIGEERDALTPNELIHLLLQLEVELMWFGGIGTYVRSSRETDAAAGDRTNDAVRIEATQLRAQVVGEGANLALTQRARVEYALCGGRLFTDFIDNSAGVDCSDHEVNIKILLGEIERAGDITRKQRDELLVEMTDEVAELVLRDNYLQTQSLAVTHQLGHHLLDRLARFMRALERAGRLDRKLEFLPDDEELAERLTRGRGLTQPELCTLFSYSKMALYDELLGSDLPDDPSLADDLQGYFPSALRRRYPQQIAAHRMRREIVATLVTNEIVNRVGISFMHEVRERTGHTSADIARAFIISRSVFGLEALWAEIEALDSKPPARSQAALLAECGRLIDRASVWFLRNAELPLDVAAQTAQYGAGIADVSGHLEEMLGADQRRAQEVRASALESEGAPGELAERVARLAFLVPALDIVQMANATDVSVRRVAETYFRIGSRFGFNWLRRAAQRLPSDTAWDKLAITSLVDDLEGHQRNLARRILSTPNGHRTAKESIDVWASTRRPLVSRAEQLLGELQSQPALDFAMLAVASRQLNAMIG